MRAKDLQGFGPVGKNGPTDTLVNHAEAHESACYKQANSNLARCYLDLERQLAEARERSDACERLLAQTCATANEALARANEAESQLAAQRERDGRLCALLEAAIGPAGADFCMNPELEADIDAAIKDRQ
jgi:hypothetical protein